MKTPNSAGELPSEVASRLEAVRQRDLRIRFLYGLVRGLALAIGVMMIAMLTDLVVGWLSPGARWMMTLGSLGLAAIGFAVWLAIPLVRRPSQIDIAQTIDQKTPHLEERWSTVTELSNNQDPAEIRGSESLIRAVQTEAKKLNFHVNEEKIISDAPLRFAGKCLVAVAVLLLAFVVWDFPQAKVLLTRFWLPSSSASLTKIELLTRSQNVPLREGLDLDAMISGRIRESGTFVTLRDPNGEERLHPMLIKGDQEGHFTFPIKSVKDSFEFRVQSGDGRTDWQQVNAVSRPKITEIRLAIAPPEYSGLPPKNLSSLPHRVRILEGSQVELQFKADQDLEELRMDIDGQEPRRLLQGDDGWYRFADQPAETMAFKTVLRNKFDLENKTKPSSRFIVYQDLPPVVRVLEPTPDVAKKADDTVAIQFEASDDFGIKTAMLKVSQIDEDGTEQISEFPIDLADQEGKKTLRKEIELDLAQFDLKQGDELSYVVSVTDTRATEGSSDPSESGERSSDSSDPSEQLAQNETEADEKDDSSSSKSQSSNSDSQSQAPNMAQKDDTGEKSEQDRPENDNPAPPPNNMAMRALDVGQSGECKPRNIKIDEWAGGFDGESKEKLQLAIDPVLQRLKKLLGQARDTVVSTRKGINETGAYLETEVDSVSQAKDFLRQAASAISELESKTSGTPYAFMGLQLKSIGTNHIEPATESLRSISSDDFNKIETYLEDSQFHIERALAQLNDLEKSYESIKREEKIEDAMQRLAKMHQLFLENSQKLLGNKKPALNSYDRKIAEVDDEYVEQLKELLEEKKKIMDELAKLLAEDPRMLRRYLAMMQLQGTSQRDQMTLLAHRQAQLRDQVVAWEKTDVSERPALAQAFRQQLAGELSETIDQSTKMHENMETWLPLDVDPEHVAVLPLKAETRDLIESLGRTLSAASNDANNDSLKHAEEALLSLRSLHEQLPSLSDEIQDEPKIDIYVANRLEEVERLISVHSGWIRMMKALEEDDFAKTAEITQHTLAQDTATLKDKIVTVQEQVSSMTEEIAETAEELVRIVQTDILYPQSLATENLSDADWKNAAEMENHLVTAFSLAESSFDRLLNLMIEEMDKAPAPTAPGSNKTLDDLLTMLENEMKAKESLGIPNRPLNISLMTDWMKPSSGSMPGSSMAQAQAKAAQAQAQQAKEEAERLQKQANAAAKAQLAKHDRGQGVGSSGGADAQGPEAPKKSWNVLVSQLEKDILQGRDNVPPEKYRDAINAYFQTISENVPSATRQ